MMDANTDAQLQTEIALDELRAEESQKVRHTAQRSGAYDRAAERRLCQRG